jgi:hypothetical protein
LPVGHIQKDRNDSIPPDLLEIIGEIDVFLLIFMPYGQWFNLIIED